MCVYVCVLCMLANQDLYFVKQNNKSYVGDELRNDNSLLEIQLLTMVYNYKQWR